MQVLFSIYKGFIRLLKQFIIKVYKIILKYLTKYIYYIYVISILKNTLVLEYTKIDGWSSKTVLYQKELQQAFSCVLKIHYYVILCIYSYIFIYVDIKIYTNKIIDL